MLNKDKSAICPLFNHREVLPSVSDKAELFAKNFFKNSHLEDSDIVLPAFPSRTNLKLHNTSATPLMVKDVIKIFDWSNSYDSDCTLVVVLKNCEPELSHILAELFNMRLKGTSFPDCWKLSLVVPVFKNIGKVSTPKSFCPLILLSLVSNSLKNL